MNLKQQNQKSNSFNLKFNSKGNINFIEKKHHINDIQIKTLDDELDSFTLFEMNEAPIDISSYIVLFDPFKGIDIF